MPKSREISAVYTYVARQGMRACNNNNMRNPSLHPLISGYACYYCCMPSIPVLLHIYCTCFSTFWHCHPYILLLYTFISILSHLKEDDAIYSGVYILIKAILSKYLVSQAIPHAI